jgi:hypothetical protein
MQEPSTAFILVLPVLSAACAGAEFSPVDADVSDRPPEMGGTSSCGAPSVSACVPQIAAGAPCDPVCQTGGCDWCSRKCSLASDGSTVCSAGVRRATVPVTWRPDSPATRSASSAFASPALSTAASEPASSPWTKSPRRRSGGFWPVCRPWNPERVPHLPRGEPSGKARRLPRGRVAARLNTSSIRRFAAPCIRAEPAPNGSVRLCPRAARPRPGIARCSRRGSRR